MSPDECRRILGVDRHAVLDDLKRAKKRLLLQYHPDQNPGRREWADHHTKLVLAAYDLLYVATPSTPADARPRAHERGGVGSVGFASQRAADREARPAHKDLHYVVVRIHGQLLGLPLTQVVQVVPMRREEFLAASGALHRLAIGYVTHNKMRVPLLDVGAALGYDKASADDCRHFVVVNAKAGQVAVAVDQVEQVATINATAIEPAGQFAPRHKDLLKGVFHWNSGCVVIPDLDAILC
jgi:chemotaxis signal transduction protein